MEEITFLQLYSKYISFHGNTSNPFDRSKANTIQAYKNRYKLVQEFLFEKDLVTLKSTEFSITFARDFMKWLEEKENNLGKKYSHNYCVRVVEMCRAIMQYGASHELISFNPLQPLKLHKTPPKRPVFLTPEEIQNIHNYDAPNSMIDKAKDMFLFQCYTGLDYGDLTSV
jgi:site-specific recombinase XerD